MYGSGKVMHHSIADCIVASPPFRTIKEHPQREIRRELLEAVFLERGHENERPRSNSMPLGAIEEQTRAAGNHVRLIARMRPLSIFSSRGIKLHLERAVREDWHSEIARRRVSSNKCAGEIHVHRRARTCHAPDLLVALR
jgi:hypothetical protein